MRSLKANQLLTINNYWNARTAHFRFGTNIAIGNLSEKKPKKKQIHERRVTKSDHD